LDSAGSSDWARKIDNLSNGVAYVFDFLLSYKGKSPHAKAQSRKDYAKKNNK